MRAVDTNILARYIINDDPVQAALAIEVLRGPTFVSETVLLETAWLLGSRYGMKRQDLADTLTDLLRLPSLDVENSTLIAWAIARFAAGADIADMIHIVAGRHADAFVSFETELAAEAGPDTPVPIERPA